MKLTAITLNGVPMLRKKNPHRLLKHNAFAVYSFEDIETNNAIYREFEENNPPIPHAIPDLKDGDEIEESECDLVWQFLGDRTDEWDNCASEDQANRYANEGCDTRQAYVLKYQPALNETHVCCGMISNPETGIRLRGSKVHGLCGLDCMPVKIPLKEVPEPDGDILVNFIEFLLDGKKELTSSNYNELIKEFHDKQP